MSSNETAQASKWQAIGKIVGVVAVLLVGPTGASYLASTQLSPASVQESRISDALERVTVLEAKLEGKLEDLEQLGKDAIAIETNLENLEEDVEDLEALLSGCSIQGGENESRDRSP